MEMAKKGSNLDNRVVLINDVEAEFSDARFGSDLEDHQSPAYPADVTADDVVPSYVFGLEFVSGIDQNDMTGFKAIPTDYEMDADEMMRKEFGKTLKNTSDHGWSLVMGRDGDVKPIARRISPELKMQLLAQKRNVRALGEMYKPGATETDMEKKSPKQPYRTTPNADAYQLTHITYLAIRRVLGRSSDYNAFKMMLQDEWNFVFRNASIRGIKLLPNRLVVFYEAKMQKSGGRGVGFVVKAPPVEKPKTGLGPVYPRIPPHKQVLGNFLRIGREIRTLGILAQEGSMPPASARKGVEALKPQLQALIIILTRMPKQQKREVVPIAKKVIGMFNRAR